MWIYSNIFLLHKFYFFCQDNLTATPTPWRYQIVSAEFFSRNVHENDKFGLAGSHLWCPPPHALVLTNKLPLISCEMLDLVILCVTCDSRKATILCLHVTAALHPEIVASTGIYTAQIHTAQAQSCDSKFNLGNREDMNFILDNSCKLVDYQRTYLQETNLIDVRNRLRKPFVLNFSCKPEKQTLKSECGNENFPNRM